MKTYIFFFFTLLFFLFFFFIYFFFTVGDGRLGFPSLAPYNAIHVGAAAPELPQHLVDQLAPGGRLVVPIGKEHSSQNLEVVNVKSI